MSISNFNLKGEQKHNINHFASLVKLAMADGEISKEENNLLNRVAKKLHIHDEQVKNIIATYKEYQVTTPHGYDDRIELLYDYTKMIYADAEVAGEEVSLLRKTCVGIGFPVSTADKVAEEAIQLVLNDTDLDDFNKAIKKVNKS